MWLAEQALILVGSIMLVIGPYMAWVTCESFSTSGLQWTADKAVVLIVMGAIGAVLALASLLIGRSILPLIPVIVGLAGLAISVQYYVQVRGELPLVGNAWFPAKLGDGVHVCLIGAALSLAGGVAAGLRKNRSGPRPVYEASTTRLFAMMHRAIRVSGSAPRAKHSHSWISVSSLALSIASAVLLLALLGIGTRANSALAHLLLAGAPLFALGGLAFSFAGLMLKDGSSPISIARMSLAVLMLALSLVMWIAVYSG